MRYSQIAENAGDYLPATIPNINKAKQFVFEKWKQRAIEMGRSVPTDLSSSCKFTSLFAANIFGGVVKGNYFHHWCELPNGKILDLNVGSKDVNELQAGIIPEYAKTLHMVKLPAKIYTNNQKYLKSRDVQDSINSVIPRVDKWVEEFLAKEKGL